MDKIDTVNEEKTYLCFDLGTTRIKSALIDFNGKIIYQDSENTVSHCEDNSIFQKPEEYYDSVEKQIKRISKKHAKHFRNIESLIFSGQMAGILAIDKNWEVVIPWTGSLDTRSNKYMDYIENTMAARIRNSSGGLPYMASKIMWVKNDFKKEYKKIRKFINLTTYVAGRLAGLDGDEAFIDYSVLAMHGLADINNKTWNKKIAEDLDLDIFKLPEILPPYGVAGKINKNRFDTKNDIKILVGVGDQIAGFIGAGIINKGDIVDVAGTYTVLGYATDRFIPDRRGKIISSIYSGIEDIYYHLAVVALGGYLYNWFIDNLKFDRSKMKNNKNTEHLYFIPYIGGRAVPYQPYYQGTFYGLKWHHDIESMFIAMLECIGYEYDFIYGYLKKLNGNGFIQSDSIKVIGGGAHDILWNEIKANILKLKYMAMQKTSFEILGNFIIARYGIGIKKGYRELVKRKKGHFSIIIKPDKEKIKYYNNQKLLYAKVVARIGEVYKDLG